MKSKDTKRMPRHFGKHWKRLRGRREDSDTTKQYTPQDVHALLRSQENGSGIIRPNTNDLHLPVNIEGLGEREQTGSPPRILFVIVTLALIFISIVTYFISKMPLKD